MSTHPPLAGRIADYRPRLVDAELERRLRATGAVLIVGPRGCGKTQTGLRLASSAVRLDRDRVARAAGEVSPMLLLEGAKPRLIDEWQLVKEVWNEVRGDVDDHPGGMGRYILAGSAVPSDDEIRHTGSTRITRLRMRPMSLTESGHSSGAVSLGVLFDGGDAGAPDPGLDIRSIAERVVVRSWPALLRSDPDDAMVATQGYLDETRRVDLARLGVVMLAGISVVILDRVAMCPPCARSTPVLRPRRQRPTSTAPVFTSLQAACRHQPVTQL